MKYFCVVLLAMLAIAASAQAAGTNSTPGSPTATEASSGIVGNIFGIPRAILCTVIKTFISFLNAASTMLQYLSGLRNGIFSGIFGVVLQAIKTILNIITPLNNIL